MFTGNRRDSHSDAVFRGILHAAHQCRNPLWRTEQETLLYENATFPSPCDQEATRNNIHQWVLRGWGGTVHVHVCLRKRESSSMYSYWICGYNDWTSIGEILETLPGFLTGQCHTHPRLTGKTYEDAIVPIKELLCDCKKSLQIWIECDSKAQDLEPLLRLRVFPQLWKSKTQVSCFSS